LEVRKLDAWVLWVTGTVVVVDSWYRRDDA
jgi:hypothetical protein